ncbi:MULTISPECIES: TatD family hydrolase [unclassified Adlercreutzia]|uniref:TatD family hydrolase n=1 Tax=unclassified Adlercreutzia TaxID=2636013 RepID=UPI0013ECA1CB|nr:MULTISPECIES: TatD family hydrolase [unclassified Adlercreutzia]
MTLLFDMHCHLDFASNAKSIAAELENISLTALCATVVPSSYVAAVEEFKPWRNIFVALGMHPWWIANERISKVDLTRFENLLPTTPFIGEIGLDFYGKRKATKIQQQKILDQLLGLLSKTSDRKIIFLHSVHSNSELLSALESHKTPEQHICVFHWFQGTPEDFARALEKDCWFSVGKRMLATESGRKFAKAVPQMRLLVETDSPPHEGMEWSTKLWTDELNDTIATLAKVREQNIDELQTSLRKNSELLLSAQQPS